MNKGTLVGACVVFLAFLAVIVLLGSVGVFGDKVREIIRFSEGIGGSINDSSSGAFEGGGITGAVISEQSKNYDLLILKVLELREDYASSDLISQAEKVTEIDNLVSFIKSQPIDDSWETTALCIAKNCADTDFLDFILDISLESGKTGSEKGRLIVNLLTADKYWNTDNTLQFSQALTDTNSEIENFNSEAANAKWKEIVECNGACSQKDQLLFELLKLIVS